MKEHPSGNLEFLEVIKSGRFDEPRAKEIIARTNLTHLLICK